MESSLLSVSAIAYACGYQQPESLMKLFRQQYGMSPSAYRKLIRDQAARAQEDGILENTLSPDLLPDHE